ncbi:MAG: para-aminobenzoate synthase, (PABA) [Bogoriella megaspora]|nr:MAG: para-aminobenzoate synthase, (PABA) [Bogoriella megaspora]
MENRSEPPSILYIDAYDSFANNIIKLLERQINARVEKIYIDDPRFQEDKTKVSFSNYVSRFDAVIAGPGPGTPENEKDIGLIAELWRLDADHVVPVLGICLGFQSLVLSHGGTLYRLYLPRHGIVTRVVHSHQSIFHDIDIFGVTQYNSLAVELTNAELLPIAYHRSSTIDGMILSAVCHSDLHRKPFWGVQFHPESICAGEEGTQMIRNWWLEAERWNCTHRRIKKLHKAVNGSIEKQPIYRGDKGTINSGHRNHPRAVQHRIVSSAELDLTIIQHFAEASGETFVLLESVQKPDGRPIHCDTGRFTIAGFCNNDTPIIQYFVSDHRVEICKRGGQVLEKYQNVRIWPYLKSFIKSNRASGGDAQVPFWGGLIGFISYEAALESIHITGNQRNDRPDMCFAFVERSLVIDHVENRTWVQSIKANDQAWLLGIEAALIGARMNKEDSAISQTGRMLNIKRPSKESYCKMAQECLEEICAGNSYELCLTAETVVSIPSVDDISNRSWRLYRKLRELNGAPFAAYMRFEMGSCGVSIVSSSPERFLNWNREGHCQFRPIKGTLKKAPGQTWQDVERYFKSTKERAENLMIVDLIRHDLNGVLRTGEAKVTKLMGVEEYATVYQLVSVIEGDLSSQSENSSGIDVLAASLPPGSMTGAPKKRSCEILNRIEENRQRGIYSGVIGYLDVGGGGDFSVSIRTAFSWDDEQRDGQSIWRIGAGGAITAQSDEKAEFDEMLTKLDVVLGIFD